MDASVWRLPDGLPTVYAAADRGRLSHKSPAQRAKIRNSAKFIPHLTSHISRVSCSCSCLMCMCMCMCMWMWHVAHLLASSRRCCGGDSQGCQAGLWLCASLMSPFGRSKASLHNQSDGMAGSRMLVVINHCLTALLTEHFSHSAERDA